MNTENNENQKEKKTSQQMHKVKTIIIDTGKIRQTKAFARQDGAILGAIWIVSFVCTMLAVDPQYQMLGFISNILIIATPFVVAKRLKAFRDYARDGHISFRHAFYDCIQTFFNRNPSAYPCAISLVPFYGYESIHEPTANQLSDCSTSVSVNCRESKALLDAVSMMKPIAWASTFMITDLVAGAVLSPIIAAVMAKKKQTTAYKITINKRQTDKYKIMDISVIIPLFNEEESLPELFAWIKRVMASNDFTYEVIFVNDGSHRPFMERHRRTCREERASKGYQIPQKLWKEPSTLLWFQRSTGRCCHHHGCRSTGFSRRDSGTLPDDYERGIRPRVRLQAEP